MRDEATCDACNAGIQPGQGYLFYSTASAGVPGMTMEIGALLYCEACTADRISDASLSKLDPSSREITLDTKDSIGSVIQSAASGIRAANIASISQACRRHGLTAAQARTKARELAGAWWENKERGSRAAQAFWTSSESPRSRPDLGPIDPITAGVQNVLEQASLMFVEARRGRATSKESPNTIAPVLEPLPHYPLQREPNRRKRLEEEDEDASQHNAKVDEAQRKVDSATNASTMGCLIGVSTIIASGLLSLGRFVFSLSFLNWFSVPIALGLAVVPSLVVYLVMKRTPAPPEPEEKKPLNFRDSKNRRCPGCNYGFATKSDVDEAEKSGHKSANEMLKLAALSKLNRSQTLRDYDGDFMNLAIMNLRNAAREVAIYSLRLGYLCRSCNLRFCGACTGGAEIDVRVCPDCDSNLVAEG